MAWWMISSRGRWDRSSIKPNWDNPSELPGFCGRSDEAVLAEWDVIEGFDHDIHGRIQFLTAFTDLVERIDE